MLDPTTAERIRAIFLHDNERVTIEDAAAMLGLSEADILAAIEAGDIETIETCSGSRIDTRELAEQAVHLWPLKVIEEALGRDASMVMTAGLRSAKLTVHVPAFLIQVLHILAGENGEAADAPLARELHGLAHMNRERLTSRIIEFDDCVDWPIAEYDRAS
jgi:hypothetical protein